MSTEYSGSIRPVSARYAAQIKELLTHQVRERIAEAEEASRKAVEPDSIITPARDAAETAPEKGADSSRRDPIRLAAPAVYGPVPVDPSGQPATAADLPPPATLLDLKV